MRITLTDVSTGSTHYRDLEQVDAGKHGAITHTATLVGRSLPVCMRVSLYWVCNVLAVISFEPSYQLTGRAQIKNLAGVLQVMASRSVSACGMRMRRHEPSARGVLQDMNVAPASETLQATAREAHVV